jgi:hypothetical protein
MPIQNPRVLAGTRTSAVTSYATELLLRRESGTLLRGLPVPDRPVVSLWTGSRNVSEPLRQGCRMSAPLDALLVEG